MPLVCLRAWQGAIEVVADEVVVEVVSMTAEDPLAKTTPPAF